MSSSVRVGPKFQVVIPTDVRQKVNIHHKDELLVEAVGGAIFMIPRPKSFSDFIIGLGKEVWQGIDSREFLRKERDSWK